MGGSRENKSLLDMNSAMQTPLASTSGLPAGTVASSKLQVPTEKKRRVRKYTRRGARSSGKGAIESTPSPGSKKRGREESNSVIKDDQKKARKGDEQMVDVGSEETFLAGLADQSYESHEASSLELSGAWQQPDSLGAFEFSEVQAGGCPFLV